MDLDCKLDELLAGVDMASELDRRRAYIRKFLLRAVSQQAIPIVNYNDPVSFEENRKMELMLSLIHI